MCHLCLWAVEGLACGAEDMDEWQGFGFVSSQTTTVTCVPWYTRLSGAGAGAVGAV